MEIVSQPISRLVKSILGEHPAAINFRWLLGDRIFRLFANLIVGFAIARSLGPKDFGILNYATAAVSIAMLAVELGLDAVLKREFANTRHTSSALLATGCLLRLGGGVLAYGGIFIASVYLEETTRNTLRILGLTLFMPGFALPDLWLQMRLQARVSVLAQNTAVAVGAMAKIILATHQAPLSHFVWVTVLETAGTVGLLAWFSRHAGLLWRIGDANLLTASDLLKQAWPLAIAAIAVTLYLRLDTIMINWVCGPAEVGIYAVGTRFAEVWFFLPLAIASTSLPGLLAARKEGASRYSSYLRSLYELSAGVGYLLAGLTCLLYPFLVRWAYGSNYSEAIPVGRLYVWSLPFIFIGVIRTQYLVNEGLRAFYLLATLVGLGINFALNLILIPRHGAWGAALATMISQVVATWLSGFGFRPTISTARTQSMALFFPFRFLLRSNFSDRSRAL